MACRRNMLFAIPSLATSYDLPNQPSKRRLLDPRSHQIHHPDNTIDVLNLRRQDCPLFWVATAANYNRNFIHSSQKALKISSSNLDFNNLATTTNDHRLRTQPGSTSLLRPIFHLFSAGVLRLNCGIHWAYFF